MLKVVNFDEVGEFVDIMNHLPHACPSRLFTDQEKNQLRKFKLSSKEGESRQIESVCLFKEGIHPSWEDESNIQGCSIQYNFNFICNDVIDNIWRKMLVDTASGELIGFAHLNGIRILEKFSPSRKIKVEFWYNTNVQEDKAEYQLLLDHNLAYFQSIHPVDKIETKCNIHQTSNDKFERSDKKDKALPKFSSEVKKK